MDAGPGEITEILKDVSADSPGAVDRLLEVVGDQLRRRADHKLAELPPWRTLDPTDLVNELYVRLFGEGRTTDWENRRHFFMTASRAMRDIIVERARRATTLKRGGAMNRVPLQEDNIAAEDPAHVIVIHETLLVLDRIRPRAVQVVQLRYFAGMTEEEAARIMGVSKATVKREFALARGWLREKLVTPDD
ncbi:MAG: ECF-type sigma factor [Planctomycetota bacterium]